MESTNKKLKITEVYSVKLDFDKLAEWRGNTVDQFPINSFLSLYEACGLVDVIKKADKPIVAADSLVCNFYTLQKLKNFIQGQWEIYSMDIIGDNQVVWKNDQWGHNPHYHKKLRARVRNSVNTDFLNFCPGVEDEMEDDVLTYRTYEYADQDLTKSSGSAKGDVSNVG